MARIILLAGLAALLPLQDAPADKAVRRLLELMDRGAFVEGRALAAQICKAFPDTPAARTAHPYTLDNAFLSVAAMTVSGPARNRLDLVVMPDGLEYDNRAQERWRKEAETVLKALFESETLKEYAPYFNTYRAHVASKAERLNKPDGAVVTFFKSRDDDGEILTDGFAARDVAAASGAGDRLALVQVRPAAALHGLSGYGVAAVGGSRPTPAALLHAFGHAFAGLADESARFKVYRGMERKRDNPPPVPVAPNVTDSRDRVPWAHWLKARDEGDKRAARIGVHEGAAYRPMKAWRPVEDSMCVMNEGGDFCPVCREAVVLLLYSYVRPIDAALPCDKILTVAADSSLDLWVLPMAPATHRLTVGWIVEKAWPGDQGGYDAEGRAGDDELLKKELRCGDGRPGPRNGEGPAWRIPRGELRDGVVRPGADGAREVLTVGRAQLGPGRFRVTAVVRDGTDWVLRDTQNLLVDWRTWVVDIK